MALEERYVGPDDEPDEYLLIEQVGRGGEGAVWRAQTNFGGGTVQVAVKELRLPDTPAERRRLREQVRLLGMIRHANVVGGYASFEGAPPHLAGRARSAAGTRMWYLVTNWVDGVSLSAWVRERTRPDERQQLIPALIEVADTLDWLHANPIDSTRPVIHGDITPGNIIITPDGRPCLIDFGLFRYGDHQTHAPRGTQAFAAPEIWDGVITAAADRYSFGRLAYYALTGTTTIHTATQARDEFLRLLDGHDPDNLATLFAENPAARPSRLGPWIRALPWTQTTTSGPATSLPPLRPGTAIPGRHRKHRTPPSNPPRRSPHRAPRQIWTRAAVLVAMLATISAGIAAWRYDPRQNTATPIRSTWLADLLPPVNHTGEWEQVRAKIVGQPFDKSIVTTPPDCDTSRTYAEFNLGGRFKRLIMKLGISDDAPTTDSDSTEAQADFIASTDRGRSIAVPDLHVEDPPAILELDVTGASRLTLEVRYNRHCRAFFVWASPRLS